MILVTAVFVFAHHTSVTS